jgi:hypothetical protein
MQHVFPIWKGACPEADMAIPDDRKLDFGADKLTRDDQSETRQDREEARKAWGDF